MTQADLLKDDRRAKKYSLTYQWSIFIEKTGPSKWISKWRGHRTLKGLLGHHGWPNSRIAKTVTFWPWWQPFNSFSFETGEDMPCPPPGPQCAWLWKVKVIYIARVCRIITCLSHNHLPNITCLWILRWESKIRNKKVRK